MIFKYHYASNFIRVSIPSLASGLGSLAFSSKVWSTEVWSAEAHGNSSSFRNSSQTPYRSHRFVGHKPSTFQQVILPSISFQRLNKGTGIEKMCPEYNSKYTELANINKKLEY